MEPLFIINSDNIDFPFAVIRYNTPVAEFATKQECQAWVDGYAAAYRDAYGNAA